MQHLNSLTLTLHLPLQWVCVFVFLGVLCIKQWPDCGVQRQFRVRNSLPTGEVGSGPVCSPGGFAGRAPRCRGACDSRLACLPEPGKGSGNYSRLPLNSSVHTGCLSPFFLGFRATFSACRNAASLCVVGEGGVSLEQCRIIAPLCSSVLLRLFT